MNELVMSQILNKTFEWVSFFSQLSIEISVSYQLLTWSSIFLMGISFSLVFFLKIPKEDKKNKNWNRTLELQVNSHERKNMLQIYILTGRDFILVRKSIIVIAVVIRQCGNCNQNLQKKTTSYKAYVTLCQECGVYLWFLSKDIQTMHWFVGK